MSFESVPHAGRKKDAPYSVRAISTFMISLVPP